MLNTRKRVIIIAGLMCATAIAASATVQITAAAAKPFIEMANASGVLPGTNSRTAGSVELVTIRFVGADGVPDSLQPLTVKTSSNALLTVTPTAQPGIYTLAVPANTTGGNATLIATAVVNGVTYVGGRNFAISAAAGSPTPTPAPTPTGSSTMTRATTPTLAADQSGCSVVNYYDVGPGKAFTALSALPWSTLKGCDTVRIYPKAGNEPYNEMILISAGTNLTPTAPNRFMRVLGMRDSETGALPILDGANATQLETLPGQATPRTLQYNDNASTSPILHKLGLVMVSPQQGYNYNNGPAGYISIENLELRGARYNQPYTNAITGTGDTYHHFAACLYVEAAAHLVVKGNILHGCSNGLFINSKHGTPVALSQDVMIDNNRFYDNGNAPVAGLTGGHSEHHSYTEARDITYQYNYFGDVAPGAFGDCVKDRSSGLVVRYNTFASNCGIKFNLQDSTGGLALIYGDPGYATSYVYGNLIDIAANNTNTQLLFYGGDSGQTANYRQGTLYFYNNTMVVAGDGAGAYPDAFLFFLSQPSARAEVWNNVFYAVPATPGHQPKIMAMAYAGAGTVNLMNNWISSNITTGWLGHPSAATVTGWTANTFGNGSPGFQNEGQHLYTPVPGSPLIGGGASLAQLPTGMAPLWLPQTQSMGSPIARNEGEQIDIGAYQH